MGCFRPAIIVMAKQPVAGQAKTRLCPPLTAVQAAALAKALLHDTVANARRADCAEVVLAYAPEEAATWFASQFPGKAQIAQGNGELGERLTAVLEASWQRRYRPCIVMGADSPDLPTDFLCAALESLRPGAESAELVLGPAADGGYYLIGLQGRQPPLFTRIDWSTDRVLAQTLARAADLGLRTRLLEPWYDVDTIADLERLRANLQTAPSGVCPATRLLLERDGLFTNKPEPFL